MSGAKYLYVNQNGLPGGGPWLILPDCPGITHNTAFAAKVGGKRPGQENNARRKCICPRALRRLEKQREDAKARKIETGARKPDDEPRVHAGGRPAGAENVPTYIKNIRRQAGVPDLSRGACRTPDGLFIMDQAEAAHFRGGPMHSARNMCNVHCEVREECGQWAADAEQPAGAWPGVYGGKTHTERRKEAELKERMEAA